MVVLWPFVHAVIAALITTWDVLPPTSKAYDYFPSHIVARLGRNATIDKVVKEWIWDTWGWNEPSLNPSVALTWVNGINYTSAEVEEQASFLSSLFGCRVRPYYNPSLGWWLRDLTRVSYMYIRAPTEDPVVTGLAKHLSMVLREVGPKGRVVHLAHSGGALLTYLVAKYHLKEADRRRIDVINFGGARSITQKYFGKATNYYARNDPILLVNRRAMSLMQQVMNQTDGEVIYLKHNTSFVFLRGRAGDGLADHSFVGPTYLTALHKEAAVFRQAYYRAYWLTAFGIGKPPEMSWGRYFRKRAASATGRHNFFSNSTIIRVVSESTSTVFRKGYYWRSANKTKTNSTTTSSFLLGSLSNSTYLQNINVTSSMTTLSEGLAQRVRHIRKTSARLTGMRNFFSPSKKGKPVTLRAIGSGSSSSDGRESSRSRRKKERDPELPLSAYVEVDDDDSEWDDEDLSLMDVEEMTSRYFNP